MAAEYELRAAAEKEKGEVEDYKQKLEAGASKEELEVALRFECWLAGVAWPERRKLLWWLQSTSYGQQLKRSKRKVEQESF